MIDEAGTYVGGVSLVRFMRCTSLAVALGVLAPGAALAEQPSTSAQDTPERQSRAETLASRAFDAYEKGNYSGALSLYRQAVELAPAAAIYFNIARIYDKKLPDPQQALEFYRKCANAPDASSDLVAKSTARARELSEALQQEQTEETPPKPSNDAQDEGAKPPPADTESPPGDRLRTVGLIAGGVGIVTVGVGLGFGLKAKLNLDSAKDNCDGRNCRNQAGFDDMKAASSAATVATIACIAGGVVAAAGAGLYLFAPKGADVTSSSTAGVRLSPVIGPSQAGLSLSGVFF